MRSFQGVRDIACLGTDPDPGSTRHSSRENRIVFDAIPLASSLSVGRGRVIVRRFWNQTIIKVCFHVHARFLEDQPSTEMCVESVQGRSLVLTVSDST